MPEDNTEDDFPGSFDVTVVDDLKTVVRRLRQMALLVAASTLGTLLSLVIAFLVKVYFNYTISGLSVTSSAYERMTGNYALTRILIGVFSSIFAFAAILAIVRFESSRTRSDAMFQEISNDLQSLSSSQLRSPLGRELRIALRELAAASDLPIFPGRLGTVVYALLNLVTLILVMFFFVS